MYRIIAADYKSSKQYFGVCVAREVLMFKKMLLLIVASALFAGLSAPPCEAVMYYYNVPDVKWMSKEQAEATLKAKQYGVNFVDIEAQDYSQVGKVIKQVPAPGMQIYVEKQKTITVTLSVAANGSFVPMILLMTESAAIDAVKKVGYVPKVEYYSEEVSAMVGKVKTSDPLPYRNLAKGGTVTLKVGTAAYVMPNLVGNPADGAKQVIDQINSIKKLSLKSSITKGRTTTVPQEDQRVYEQSPAPGAILTVGAEVKLSVYVYAPPPPPKPTPGMVMSGLTGKPVQDAVSVLDKAGIKAQVNYISSQRINRGIVLAQSVKPGERTAGPVILTVNR
jgi:beta-lactam-binding protein with PASTA domain